MFRKDPCGYYAALGVDQLATSREIKRAFKARVKRAHPDRNPAPGAELEFRFVNDAYRVLGHAKARANYDARAYIPPEGGLPAAAQFGGPVVCSLCQRVTVQPRYVIYRYAFSAVFFTWRAVRQSVFCSDCGARCAYHASAVTWLLGWWGIPFGPVFSLQAIFSNLAGGEMPPLNNFRLLAQHAIYFEQFGRIGVARAVARKALVFASRIPQDERLRDPRISQMTGTLEELLASTGAWERVPPLKDPWGVHSKAFKVQLCALVVIAALVAVIVFAIAGRIRPTVHKHVPRTGTAAAGPAPAGRAVNAGKITASGAPHP
jgi:curved DNA-binding protein CbpA